MVTHNSSAWPLPPAIQISDFLSPDDHQFLLRWVLDREDWFRAAAIVRSPSSERNEVDPSIRKSLTTRDLGTIRPRLEPLLLGALPALERATGSRSAASSVELEISAHGDGGHYAPHEDLSFGQGRKPLGGEEGTDRILSAVYYFHHEPKRFTGGALRLYRLGARPLDGPIGPDDYVDYGPTQNSLVVFPSWVTHEVRTVHCPREDFKDFRFALNCWFCRQIGQ